MFPDFVKSDSTLPLTSKTNETDNPAFTPDFKSDSTPPSTPKTDDAEETTPVPTVVDHSETEAE